MGIGLGWGYGAAWGSKYIIVNPEFEDKSSSARKPGWLAQLQQQLKVLKLEKGAQRTAAQR